MHARTQMSMTNGQRYAERFIRVRARIAIHMHTCLTIAFLNAHHREREMCMHARTSELFVLVGFAYARQDGMRNVLSRVLA
jgi:hypothetical protein